MKKMLSILLAAIMTLCIAAPALAADVTADLIVDGRDTAEDIGDLDIDYMGDGFIVEFSIESPWEIVETHVYIGEEPPAKSSPGKFPYEAGYIAFEDTGMPVYIAAHAEVRMEIEDEEGNIIYLYETVWAQARDDMANSPIGKGANWATYFQFPFAVG